MVFIGILILDNLDRLWLALVFVMASGTDGILKSQDIRGRLAYLTLHLISFK